MFGGTQSLSYEDNQRQFVIALGLKMAKIDPSTNTYFDVEKQLFLSI